VATSKDPTSRKAREKWGTLIEFLAELGDTVEWGEAVRREPAVAIWIGERKKVSDPGFPLAAGRRAGVPALHRMGMDITWLTERIAVGGGIWNSENMAKVAKVGITHIIDMQIEFDDTPLARDHGIEVLWNPTDDDFEFKPAELLRRGVDFAQTALEGLDAKVFIHCAAGVHRAPMMALAVLGSMGWPLGDAMALIETRRPVADFADVYVRSVEEFLNGGVLGD
jgi:protein tyrosine phosphatase (PTP) superfamily phosphohydrolase (DUF442 family)